MPSRLACARRVDPRGCGGDSRASRSYIFSTGRSPRVRGRLSKDDVSAAFLGSIPAGAGETRNMCVSSMSRRVDPRGCGGDVCTRKPGRVIGGRSPRVRGRPGPFAASPRGAGSIPAGAGETPRWRRARPRGRVDPRGCGGDGNGQYLAEQARGRSPRVRGRRGRCVHIIESYRSIPAGAGETALQNDKRIYKRVDPRGCGGDDCAFDRRENRRGRSPRVRGRLA